MSPLTLGSLFAGIGGLDLGLERAGMEVRWQVEIDEYCRKVLAKHWPNARSYPDVRHVGSHEWADAILDEMVANGYGDGGSCPTSYYGLEKVDVICGGFPCQDVSVAGARKGIREDTRSGLWFEFARIVRDLRPAFVVVENVPGLLANGMGRVLGDLAEIGYDAEWHCLSAAGVGAPHLRNRIFVIAHSHSGRPHPQQERREKREGTSDAGGHGAQESLAVGNADRTGCGEQRRPLSIRTQLPTPECASWWASEPDVGRVAHGVPSRVDRLRSLGNAVVPQVAEYIGRLIVSHAQQNAPCPEQQMGGA